MLSVSSLFKTTVSDPSALMRAIQTVAADDSLTRFLSQEEWMLLANYLNVETLPRGHILTAKGALDRTVYFVESGTLRILYGAESDRNAVAILGAGSVVGEGAFFSQRERNATVQATTVCRVWSLALGRFDQLRKEHPTVALSLAMALGATAAGRMLDMTKRFVVV